MGAQIDLTSSGSIPSFQVPPNDPPPYSPGGESVSLVVDSQGDKEGSDALEDSVSSEGIPPFQIPPESPFPGSRNLINDRLTGDSPVGSKSPGFVSPEAGRTPKSKRNERSTESASGEGQPKKKKIKDLNKQVTSSPQGRQSGSQSM